MKLNIFKDKALDQLNAEEQQKAIDRIKEKALQLREAKRVVKAVQASYDKLLDEDIHEHYE